MPTTEFVIGTRGSRLALAQTRVVATALAQAHPGARFKIKVIKTRGDAVLGKSLRAIGDKGLFTKQLELALLGGRIHLAVHSMKDLPTDLPPGLCVAAMPPREAPFDVLVSRLGPLHDLPAGARVGTGSLRRRAQVRAMRPDLAVCDIRGNVDTRLGKLREGVVDGVILAMAGLRRLGRVGGIAEQFNPERFIPAVGQGAIGIEAVSGSDAAMLARAITDEATESCVRAERAMLGSLGGGCQVPVGGYAKLDRQGRLRLAAVVCSLDGTEAVRHARVGHIREPERLGRALGRYLIEHGADAVLATAAHETEA